MMIPTLPEASQPLTSLQPLLMVAMSTQMVQVPVLVIWMMAFCPALQVVTLALVHRATCSHYTTMMMISPLFSPFTVLLLVAAVTTKVLIMFIVG